MSPMQVALRWASLLVGASTLILSSVVFSDAANAQTNQRNDSNQATESVAQGSQEKAGSGHATQDRAGQDAQDERIYDRGWSAVRLFDEAAVIGVGDEPIGDLENIIIGSNGDIEALILEIGGNFDIGDTHVALPWNDVKVDDDLRHVVTQISQDNVADYSLFESKWFTQADVDAKQVVESGLWTGPFLWKATKLLNEFVYLRVGKLFGYVSDLIFVDGELEAVVINTAPGYGGGLKAVPYGAFKATIGRPRFSADYDGADLASLEPFDYDRMPEKVDINP